MTLEDLYAECRTWMDRWGGDIHEPDSYVDAMGHTRHLADEWYDKYGDGFKRTYNLCMTYIIARDEGMDAAMLWKLANA